MPRMNLEDDEAQLVLRHRREKEKFNEGWNAALNEALTLVHRELTYNEIRALVEELRK